MSVSSRVARLESALHVDDGGESNHTAWAGVSAYLRCLEDHGDHCPHLDGRPPAIHPFTLDDSKLGKMLRESDVQGLAGFFNLEDYYLVKDAEGQPVVIRVSYEES